MAAIPFGAFISTEAESRIPDLPAVLHKDVYSGHASPSKYELDQLTFGNRYNGPSTKSSDPVSPNFAGMPPTPCELETSRTSSPEHHGAVDIVQSLTNPPMNKWRFISACLMCFANGLNDSAPGALIPYIEPYYNIGYAVVSLIFVANAVGFIAAAFYSNTLLARFGRARVLVFAESLLVIGYTMIVCSPPFPVVVIAFLITGLGMATNLALNNVFVANLTNATTYLGIFHGSYGIGGVIGPLIATGLVSNGHRWSSFYFITLGVAVFNLGAAYWSFRYYERDLPLSRVSTLQHESSHGAPDHQVSGAEIIPSKVTLFDAVRNKTTLLGALFIFAYQGAEVSISGWVISFLLTYRRPEPSSRASIGYVTAGFWAGITLGRFTLSHPCHRLGEKISVFILVAGATGFELLVWLVPNIIGEAVAVALVGLLLGPVYPCATVIFSKLIGRKRQMSSLAFISAMGSSGGALLPFMTGLIAQSAGTWVLHPICVSAFACMVVCWACLDKVGKRRE
ncbi:hypothetical protein MMC19_003319 [Ptychographa xylographoides]|nr:hypothetical protein [Ptychographa xylographoides]